MQIPFIVLSYDEFVTSKKLFSYERDGIHTLPVFTDPSRALKFANKMTTTLNKQFGDKRILQPQLCSDPKLALRMFQTITAYCRDLLRIIIDPKPSIEDDQDLVSDLDNLSWVENFQDIDDVIEQIQDWITAEGVLDSEENGDPESKVP